MRLLAVFAVGLITLVGCGGSGPLTPSDGTVSVSGVVHDYATNQPVAGAHVHYAAENENPSAPGPDAVTAADGRFSLVVPHTGVYTAMVDSQIAGVARLGGPAYRGDLYLRSGTCIARYGTVSDSLTWRPVAGATVALTGFRTQTDSTGWYRLDLGCPDVVLPGNTTFMTITHPDYQDRSQVVGRGIADVSRLDVDVPRR